MTDLHDAFDRHGTYSRRAFLARGITLASAAATIPTFLGASATALARQARPDGASIAGVAEDRVLVVVQLAGGNDGLNTVIPVRDDAYYRQRPRIAVPRGRSLAVESRADVALHPALSDVKAMYDDGLVSIAQGVGYPNPNRSHFTSMDIWHTADPSGVGEGWLGRFFDNQCAGAPGASPAGGCPGDAGLAIGRRAPLAMQGRSYKPVSFESAELFRWSGLDLHESLAEPYEALLDHEPSRAEEAANPASAFLTRTALDARVASETIRRAVASEPLTSYPRSALAQQLAMVAAMVRAGLRTRVYYVSLGGFDTHAGQGGENGAHANLLRQFGGALRSFYADLRASGDDGRVMTMSFSEFGRRVGENGSRGTDHGAAAPMMLFGPMVRPGVWGEHPSLTDLDRGDLKYRVDFRSVYTGVLEDWLTADAEQVLGRRYRKASLIRV